MKTKKQENLDKWRQIVKEAESYPASLAAFCRYRGISKGSLYGWRRKLKESAPIRNITPLNPFSGVDVVDSRPALPDAKWVAEFVHHLLGCSK